jgi:hypothetical protein
MKRKSFSLKKKFKNKCLRQKGTLLFSKYAIAQYKTIITVAKMEKCL